MVENVRYFFQKIYNREDISQEQIDRAMMFFDELSKQEQKILSLRYGLEENKKFSPKEIANEFKLSEEEIVLIANKAIKKLKHPARTKKIFG